MKTLLLLSALALSAVASAQSSFSASYALDPFSKSKPVPVVSYTARTFTDVFDHKGFNLDLVGLTSVSDNLKLGFGLVYRLRKTIPFSKEFRPKLDLSIGPWVNYQPGQSFGKTKGGLFLGIGGSF